MTIVVEEKFKSRPSVVGEGAQIDLLYTIRGTTDDIAAKQALLSESPEVYDGLPRLSAEIDPVGIEGDGQSSGGGGEPNVWDGTVRYGEVDSAPPQTGESSFSFDTGGGTQHITQSLATTGVYAAPNLPGAPNFQGAIGVTENAVEGVDITVPVYNFSETHYLPNVVVTLAYRATLFYLTGRTNNAPFKGLATGEALFLGASGSKRGISGGEDWEITYRFAGSPNMSGLVVGPISGIFKGGWEYLWVRYREVEDTSAKSLVKQPVAAYVERVYEAGNFGDLLIGT